ncbi:MAG: acetyl-CoA carboxylase biotin carboxyl carrier protein [Pseudomonadota bacterium]
MKIDAKAVKALADLLDEKGLTEIEVTDGEQSIRVNRGGSNVVMSAPPAMQAAPAPIQQMPSDPTTPQQANTNAPDNTAQSHPGAITSPMVGTAYMAPEPGVDDFVKKGDSVKAGDTLMIIEAMKVMNPIKADKSGTVSQILIEDGQPVEFGDVLLVIE